MFCNDVNLKIKQTMKKTLFLPTILLFAFLLVGCNRKPQNNDSSGMVTDTIKTNEARLIQQTTNTSEQILAKPEVPVLCYHRIENGKKGDYTVSPETFSAHMKVLADSGYTSILPAQLYDYLVYNALLPEKPVMITFDDSRSEHFDIAAPVMEKHKYRGVFFIMTITYNKKNYMTTDQIAQLSAAGHTVGLHSWDHTMATKYIEKTDWEKNVIAPKQKLESIIGTPVEYWAYPNGVYNREGAAGLSEHFKLSFILTSKRDSIYPLQTVRRMIVPELSAQGLLKSMQRTFGSIETVK